MTFARHPRAWTALMVLAVGLLDYLSGLAITFVELMYLLPLGVATWYASRRAGVITAAAAAALTVLITTLDPWISAHAPVVNGLGTLCIYIAFVWVLALLRVHVDREAARLRTTVEHLRHAERLNVLGVLAAGVAHELGTPLNVISGTAEMLDEDGVPRGQARDVILGQVERITAIIQNMLDFARRGRSPKHAIELDVAVSAAVSMLASTARKRGASIALTADAAEREVRGGRAEIEQVVMNLVLNGMQAMPAGGRVAVSTRREEVVGADGVAHAYGTIIVEDEGSGIAPDVLPHIFDPFFTTKDVGEGTGLGLSVTYGIVSDLGGTIEVESQVGQGTRFMVRLPAFERPSRFAV